MTDIDPKPQTPKNDPQKRSADASVKQFIPSKTIASIDVESVNLQSIKGDSVAGSSTSYSANSQSANRTSTQNQPKPIPIPDGMPTISQNHKQTQKADKRPFALSFLLPQYWGLWIGFCILYPLIFLPLRYQFWLGKQLGIIAYQLSSRRRNITLNNLKHALPEKMDEERERMAKQVFVNQGIGVFETLCAWYRPDVFTRTVSISGLQHLVTAKKEGKRVILLSAHYTIYDLGLRLLTQFTAIDAIYPTTHNALLDWFIDNGRRHIINKKIEPKQISELTDETAHSELNKITSSNVIWLAADQFNPPTYDNVKTPQNYVNVPFFGVPTQTTTLPRDFVQLSDRSNTTVVMALHTYRQTPDNLPKGKRPHYHLTITPALQDYPTADAIADTTRTNELLEGLIRTDPTQWMWFQECYKK